MTANSNNEQDDKTDSLTRRINELGDKATQLLTFLSFALVAALLLETSQVPVIGSGQKSAVNWALRFWVIAFFPILVNIFPVKDFRWENPGWYRGVRWAKTVLLWIAVLLIIAGVIAFLSAIW